MLARPARTRCALVSLLLALAVPAGAQSAAAPPARETVAGGEYVVHPIDQRDDGVPLPKPAECRAGADADEFLAPASGDPFFLGFAAGPYYPPADERIDPALTATALSVTALAVPADGRTEEEVFAFVMFSRRMSAARVAELEAAGARVLGFHPHYCLSVALPGGAIDAVAALPFVRWIGEPRPWQKLHPVLVRELARRAPSEDVELWVDVHDSDLGPDARAETFGRAMEHDGGGVLAEVDDPTRLPRRWKSGGWRERALEARGLEVRSYSEAARAFRVRAKVAEVEELARLDYVQVVELAVESEGQHEESMPMTCADLPRASDDGGQSLAVVAGQVDSGLDNTHTAHFTGFAAGFDLTGSAGGPFTDNCGHGTHVGGTLRGSPVSVFEQHTGAAPGVGWGPTGRYYNVKLWDSCAGFFADIDAILAITHTEHTDTGGNTTPMPHLVNHSWGSSFPGPYFGTEAGARALDTDVYIYGQQHVFSAGNLGSGGQTITLQGSAKNVLTVGNVSTYLSPDVGYPGNLWTSSSRGPTGDLRWKPNLVAPGVEIASAEAGTSSGFVKKTGTSMAAPHVTGIAAQLLDRHPFLRYNAATLTAVMMAGSITKNSMLLSGPSIASTHHLNTYGTGRIDAYKASGGNAQQALFFWGFAQDENGWTQVDFPVDPGATQLTVVLHYKEAPASAGASVALRNDLDLWIDFEPHEAGGDTGDYFFHQSQRDNSEVRIIDNPVEGNWRLKVFPESVPPALFSGSFVGLCAIVQYGEERPELTLSMSPEIQYVRPLDEFEVTATVDCASYIASAVFLETTDGPPLMDAAEVTMFDGVVADLTSNEHGGRDVLLGDVPGLTSREVRWRSHWNIEGVKPWSVSASADNIQGGFETDSVTVVVDGTPPLGPANLASTSHSPGVPACATDLRLEWDAATDALAGVEGYGWVLDGNPTTEVNDPAVQLPADATSIELAISSGQAWYFHLRARDRSGNWGVTQHAGPFLQQPSSAETYCIAAANSAWIFGAIIGQTGSLSISANDFALTTNFLPSNQPCLYFYGPGETQQPFGDGFRCVSGSITRLPVINTGAGTTSYALDFTSLPPTGPIQAGDTRRFQNWYRDPMAGGAGFNLSNGLRVTFCE